MSGPPASRASLREARGAITWVTMLLIVLAVGVGYLGWVWVPLYLDNYAVRQALRASMNEAIKNNDDALLVRELCKKIRGVRTVEGIDDFGRRVPMPAVAVDERNVSWSRDLDGRPPMVHVTIQYDREVVYPFLDRVDTKTFVIEDSNDLTPVKW
jgi:hypothetical protein